MIGRSGSMIDSGGALASQDSRGGKIRPKAVLLCVALIGASPVLLAEGADYRTKGADAQARGPQSVVRAQRFRPPVSGILEQRPSINGRMPGLRPPHKRRSGLRSDTVPALPPDPLFRINPQLLQLPMQRRPLHAHKLRGPRNIPPE